MWKDEAYLLDMLLTARKVVRFTQGLTGERFDGDELLQLGFLHLVQTIGEAAAKVSRGFRKAHPEIPWGDIIGMRNRLVHDYSNIDLDEVWDVVSEDVPALISQLEGLIPPDHIGGR